MKGWIGPVAIAFSILLFVGILFELGQGIVGAITDAKSPKLLTLLSGFNADGR
jgi:hypothetical protein